MTPDNIVLEAMKYGIILIGLVVAYAEIRQAVALKETNYWGIKAALGIMGIYWTLYYFRSVLNIVPGPAHQIFVRGPLLLTLSLIAAGAIMSLKRGK
jgi:hypothetical protein